ncbi:MAG: 2-phospho-L-lactate guanylyltransferase [Actinobacteria bacterium]|nr:2-phospho-L-lactate guanylyltransferase [Actinomycetota bacterium]
MSGDVARSPRVGVVIPIRSFIGAKARLADHLDEDARATALRLMADRVLDAAAPLTVIVVSSAPEVRAWAVERGVEVVDDAGSLDAAAAGGVEHLRARGFTRAVVVHADLPHARSLAPLAEDFGADVVAMVPCHREDGTNVLSVPTTVDFTFAYGAGSFARHVAEAQQLGLNTVVIHDPELSIDVDVPDDLEHLRSSSPT